MAIVSSNILRVVGATFLGTLVGSYAMGVAHADPVTVKFSSIFPGTHYIHVNFVEKFAAAVEAESGGEIKFELYPAAQLGKDIPMLVKSGVIDMALVAAGNHPDKYPLTSVAELPQLADSSCEGNAKMWALAQPGGLVDELEYKPEGIRSLGVITLAPYVLFTRSKVEKVADVSGLKIWASGPGAQQAIGELGGVAIRIPSTDLYDAAMRGTVDGAIFPYSGLTQYKLEPILKSAANGVNFGTGVGFLSLTEKRWNEFSDEHKEILSRNADQVQREFCKYIDDSDAGLRAQVGAIDGYTMIELQSSEKEEFVNHLTKVAETWATSMDSSGKQGTAVLNAYREAAAN